MREVKHRTCQITFLLLITTVYALFINPFISFDGWQYISSAKSLFNSGQMAQHYFWIREPGFPFLTKVFSLNGSFLWGVIASNLLLFMLSYFYFFTQSIKSLTLNRKAENYCLIISYVGSVTLVGGYAGNFGRDLLIISTNLFFSALSISVFKNQISRGFNSSKTLLCLTLLFSSTLSKPLSYAFAASFVLMIVGEYFTHGVKRKSLELFLYAITLVASLILIPVYWRYELNKAIIDPLFNKQNFLDPFWDLSAGDILSRFTEDIVLVQSVPLALLSLLGVGSNIGWIFSRNDVQISPSQNADIGYGLFAQHYPNCNSSKPHGFIANIEFLQEESEQALCGISTVDLPNVLFYPIYILYIFVLIRLLLSLRTIASSSGAICLIAHLGSASIYISFFAISGGAIDRYGALLIPIVFSSIGLLMNQNVILRSVVH